MLTSSKAAASTGSGYCDRPSQLFRSGPSTAGLRVRPVFRPTAIPLTYKVAVPPSTVTARWLHWFNGSGAVPLTACSPPAPLEVMAKRGTPSALRAAR